MRVLLLHPQTACQYVHLGTPCTPFTTILLSFLEPGQMLLLFGDIMLFYLFLFWIVHNYVLLLLLLVVDISDLFLSWIVEHCHRHISPGPVFAHRDVEAAVGEEEPVAWSRFGHCSWGNVGLNFTPNIIG